MYIFDFFFFHIFFRKNNNQIATNLVAVPHFSYSEKHQIIDVSLVMGDKAMGENRLGTRFEILHYNNKRVGKKSTTCGYTYLLCQKLIDSN